MLCCFLEYGQIMPNYMFGASSPFMQTDAAFVKMTELPYELFKRDAKRK